MIQKKGYLKVSLIILLLFILLPIQANAEDSSGVIRVTGNSVVTAAPDVAYIALGVETRENSAEDASAQNSLIMARIMKALEDFGLSAKDITTSGYYIYSYQETDGTQKPGEYYTVYNVRNQINVKASDLDDVGTIIDLAIKAGANQVQGISFDIADKEEMQLNALQNATRQAQQKAEAIAAAAGVTIKGLTSITEQSDGSVPYTEEVMLSAVAAGKMMDTHISPGDVQVRVKVLVEYSF